MLWPLAFLIAAAISTPLIRLGAAPAATPVDHAALLNQYCRNCHSQSLKSGGISLGGMSLRTVAGNPELFEKVLRKIRSGEMPPPGAPRPDAATLNSFAISLEQELDRRASNYPYPGRVPVHRLNRTEYGNAVRDVLGLEIDSRTLLSADGVDQHGFDNIAGILTVSPAQLEQFVSAARKVSRLAIGDTQRPPVFETFSLPNTLSQDERMSDDLPFGSRGGMAIHYYFPVDGEYEIRIRLKRQLYGYILGMGRKHQIGLSLDGKHVKSFSVGGDAPSRPSPATFAGNVMADPSWDLYMHEADAGLSLRIKADAGPSTIGVWFTRDVAEAEQIPQPRETGFGLAINEVYDGNPAIENVAIGGPFRVDGPGDTPSRRTIFTCRPTKPDEETPCARSIVASLARKAYRRSPSEQEISILLDFYRQGRSAGFEEGIALAVERMLADPNFLFRVEREPSHAAPGTVYRLSNTELASRLSFFLWSSLPDAELLDAAQTGGLFDTHILERQVRRMLADPRSKALITNFVPAWLDIAKVRSVLPDPDVYSDFDDNLREGLLKETELFVENEMRADRGIPELLNANYTFLNERLARHYDIPNVYGSHFRKVMLSDPARGGLLSQGSVLVATSYPNRTSPVLRGKWLLDNILGAPPAPPPPDIPALKENDPHGKPLSVRERLEEHRRNPSCATCHVRMDPLGFALEHFDPIGKLRKESDGTVINAAAVLPDGTKFEGIAGLRAVVLARRRQFVETFAARLLTYALGREVDYRDAPAIRAVTRDSEAGGDRWSSVILSIVRSVPFRMSMVGPGAPPQVVRAEPPLRGNN